MVQIINDQEKTESINNLRKLILNKIDRGEDQSVEGFHPSDIERINKDYWLTNFLEYHDYNVKDALKQCWDTLEWRKKIGINDISESSVRRDYLLDGNIYTRGFDTDGKLIMFFRIRIYVCGSKTIENLRTYLLYWIERGQRESNGDKVTIVFDMIETGMKNIDMEYMRLMIGILKNYYPNSLNYLLVYDMPWILNGVFQLIKGLLPKKVVERLRFINAKNVRQYINDQYIPYEWGGSDKYELKFESEVTKSQDYNNNENVSTIIHRKISS
ncbi:hypothetical protein PVAND_006683 [Polypedilum vanderplanki]|uniref:CRAL-TRIO domain-containing protein n=1 Tax=Polypedilum vanderplanki TaxID=319348 RepID=A0A9J6C5L8_POLVA|nr:hypothetical protein PVAND_006683 [Polypedilum vanderplanki]